MRILFVCTGNICRSPSAEGVLRAKLHAHGLGQAVTVASCGTHGYHRGDPPDVRAIRVGRARGYVLDRQRARAWCAADADGFDLIVAAEEHHARWVRDRLGAHATVRVVRLLDYAPQQALRDLPDPYYGGLADFERMYDLIEVAVDGIVQECLAGPAARR